MRELEQLIAGWRAVLKTAPEVSPKALDELENHLREVLAPLLRSGMSETQAFQTAIAQLGAIPALAAEFRKLDQPVWLPIKIITGIGTVLAVIMVVTLAARFHQLRSSVLLCSHIFTLTMGYLAALLTGLLGICFAGQRCYSPFASVRLRSIGQVTFILSGISVGLTAAGLVLGTMWSRTELGRWWQWETKETSAFCVLAWMGCFHMIQWWGRTNVRAVLVLSIAGNIFVMLAWFEPSMVEAGPQSITSSFSPILLGILLLHLVFLGTGLAPARWLRSGKA